MDAGLIIFVKNPESGKVKTRLAKDIGDDQALKVYLKLLEMTRKVSLTIECSRYLFYHEAIIKEDDWNNDQYHKRVQSSGDLGERMNKAFNMVLENHSKAVIIGSDCPDITPEIINDAFKALDQYEVVIGPTFDGGYYLLGMKECHSFLFNKMEWSTDSVYAETTNRIENNDLSYYTLKILSDLDNLDDLRISGIDWEE